MTPGGLQLAICITMYNEDLGELTRTMEGVMKNYEKMIECDVIPGLNEGSILVVVIVDGADHLLNNGKDLP